MEVWVVIAGAVGPAVPAVHRAIQVVDAGVWVLILRAPLWRAAYVQDLSIIPFPGLALPQLPGLGLDPDSEDDDTKNQSLLDGIFILSYEYSSV